MAGRVCPDCKGTGIYRCEHCRRVMGHFNDPVGSGQCMGCLGTGRQDQGRSDRVCPGCHGTGVCQYCQGSGQGPCKFCGGRGWY